MRKTIAILVNRCINNAMERSVWYHKASVKDRDSGRASRARRIVEHLANFYEYLVTFDGDRVFDGCVMMETWRADVSGVATWAAWVDSQGWEKQAAWDSAIKMYGWNDAEDVIWSVLKTVRTQWLGQKVVHFDMVREVENGMAAYEDWTRKMQA